VLFYSFLYIWKATIKVAFRMLIY